MNLTPRIALGLVLVVAACGGGNDSDASETSDPEPSASDTALDAGSEGPAAPDGVLYVFDDPFSIDESQFDFSAPVVPPSIDLLDGAQGAVVNIAGVDHVYNQGIQCEVIDDDKMSLFADLGALRDLGSDIWFEMVYDATAPLEVPNLFGTNSVGSSWVFNPELLDFENDGMSLEWTRDGNTVTGTANAFSGALGESQQLAFVATC